MKKITTILTGLLALCALAGCGDGLHDYVHDGSVKLALDFKNKDFYQDGICEVTLETAIDGDTAHFKPKTGSNREKVKARFYGVDTPESTGSVEPYGFAASRFTKTKLKEAKTIVVSTPGNSYQPPKPDSTGSRYVSMIWISNKENATIDDLVSLNLWIVQEGLSWAKGLDDMPEYKETFDKAEQQARDHKLNIFSGKDDPEYNYGEYNDISLLALSKEIQAGLEDPSYEYSFNNKKVHFSGTVGGYVDGTLYLQRYYTQEEGASLDIKVKSPGEYVGINVFCGMSGIPSKYTEPNAYVEIYGLALYSENFGFQISDAHFPTFVFPDDKYVCRVLISPKDNNVEQTAVDPASPTGERGHKLHVFELSSDQLNDRIINKDYEVLYSPITITNNINCVESYTGSTNKIYSYVGDSGDISLAFEDCEFGIYIKGFQYQPDPDGDSSRTWTTIDKFIGKTFTEQNSVFACFKSAKTDKYTFQLYLSNSYGMTVVD